MNKENVTVFGETTFRNNFRKFGIKTDDRRRHMYLIGKTGMGKSTVLENMIIDDIYAGHGVAIVDPHGDLAEKAIEFIPDHRIDDVIYFNPADTNHPIAFNVVEEVGEDVRHLVASGLIGVFQKLWADSWGPRLEYILRNAILAILDHPGATLLSITRMLSDKEFREDVISNIKDPVVKAFWTKEFAGYNDKFASEAVSPIQNKVGQFLSSSLIRNIVGQIKSTIDMRKIMDEKKILILNLSKGRIGEDNSTLLGAMIITKIQLAAMSRVDIPEKERKDFYLYVDEFQNFTSDSFANILSEARKYRLNLTLAHQYIEQLTENIRNAVFGNVGTLIIFRVGAIDAEALAPELAPTFTSEDILNLPKYEIYLKLMIDGVASEPFSAKGLPPKSDSEKTGNTEKVIQLCRERYTEKKEVIEERISTWHESINIVPAGKKKKKNNEALYKYEAKCNRCKKDTKTPFEPDGVRPVYCKDCLSELREEKSEEIVKRKEEKKDELKKIDKKPTSDFQKKTASTDSTSIKKPKSSSHTIANTPKNNPKKNVPKSNPVPPGKNEEVATISLNELATAKPVGFKATKKKLTNKKNSNTSTAKKTIPKNQDKPSAPIAATTKEIELEEGNEIDFN
jgi:CxxC-x17-CxxC domain-containing protein